MNRIVTFQCTLTAIMSRSLPFWGVTNGGCSKGNSSNIEKITARRRYEPMQEETQDRAQETAFYLFS